MSFINQSQTWTLQVATLVALGCCPSFGAHADRQLRIGVKHGLQVGGQGTRNSRSR